MSRENEVVRSAFLVVDVDKRREWLRALRRFKCGIKVQAKLGVLQTICEQVAAERNGKQQWDAPEWGHKRWVTLLYTCIKHNQFPPELLIAFAKSAEVTFLNTSKQPTVARMLVVVDDVCREQSKALRQQFNVFL